MTHLALSAKISARSGESASRKTASHSSKFKRGKSLGLTFLLFFAWGLLRSGIPINFEFGSKKRSGTSSKTIGEPLLVQWLDEIAVPLRLRGPCRNELGYSCVGTLEQIKQSAFRTQPKKETLPVY